MVGVPEMIRIGGVGYRKSKGGGVMLNFLFGIIFCLIVIVIVVAVLAKTILKDDDDGDCNT
jgi:uncharacterized membrane protein